MEGKRLDFNTKDEQLMLLRQVLQASDAEVEEEMTRDDETNEPQQRVCCLWVSVNWLA